MPSAINEHKKHADLDKAIQTSNLQYYNNVLSNI